jgi:hypothetical protein
MVLPKRTADIGQKEKQVRLRDAKVSTGLKKNLTTSYVRPKVKQQSMADAARSRSHVTICSCLDSGGTALRGGR